MSKRRSSGSVKEWALLDSAGPLLGVAASVGTDGFVTANRQVLLAQDNLGPDLSAGAFRLLRLIGSCAFGVSPRGVDRSPIVFGTAMFGVSRTDARVPEGAVTVDSVEDADSVWLWRASYPIYVYDPTAPQPTLDLLPLVMGADSIQVNSAGGLPNQVTSSSSWRFDWPMRGGKGTRVEKDVRVALHFGYRSFYQVTVAPQTQGLGWLMWWGWNAWGLVQGG